MDLLIERDTGANLPGSSGAPVIDASGHLIGILSASSLDPTTGKNITVAISTEYLRQLLQDQKDYNKPKLAYGVLIFEAVLERGASYGVRLYKRLIVNPKNYYRYDFRSLHENGLRETGMKLIELNRISEAIKILKLNAREYRGHYLNHKILAEPYLRQRKRRKAVRSYQRID